MTDGPKSLPRVVAAAVEHGWSVIPVGLDKKPLVEWAPYQTVRPTLEQVERWHAELKPAGWAVVTGEISGIVVIDFDGGAGLATMHKYGILPHLRTGSGGAHAYVVYPGFRVPTLNGKSKLALQQILPGTDVRGDGGIAVCYGRNGSGPYKRLRPLSQPDPWAGPLVDKLTELLREDQAAKPAAREPGATTVSSACDARVSADEILQTYLARERNGAGRNDTGLDLACQLRDNAYTEQEAAAVMAQYAAAVKTVNTKGRPEPYTEAEARATLRSVYGRPAREPWAAGGSWRAAGNGHMGDPPPPQQDSGDAEEKQKRVGSLIVRPFSQIELKPIRWLCPGRIARGKVNLFAGHPGFGKSQLIARISATVTRGDRWPCDQTQSAAGEVIILSAEDDPEDTVGPRLKAAGADLSRVHFVQSVLAGYTGQGRLMHRLFCLEKDLEELAVTMDDIGNVALVSLDPISAYLGKTDSHHNAEVRALLAPLSEMAGRHESAIIIVSHLTKNAGAETLLRITGSLAFVAAARTAHLIAPDPEDKERRLFLPLKNNLARDIGGLAFRIEEARVEGAREVVETSRVVWEPDPVTLSADEVMRDQEPEQRSALREAVDWLQEVLSEPIPADEVLRKARKAGIAEKTLRRAADKLGVVKKKSGKGGWSWSLGMTDQDGQDGQDAQDSGRGEEGTLGAIDIEI
jgi:hypothetical protein